MPEPVDSVNDMIRDAICAQLVEGKSLVEICRQEGFPARRTVYEWQEKDEAFRSRIVRAREIGQDALIDQCREIADSATPEDVNVAKLRIWHRQWEASKRAPKQFGDKTAITDGNGGPLQFVLTRPAKAE